MNAEITNESVSQQVNTNIWYISQIVRALLLQADLEGRQSALWPAEWPA